MSQKEPNHQEGNDLTTSKNEPNHIKYGKLSSIGIEMGLSVVAGVFIGNWLDEYFDTSPIWLVFWTLAGFGAAVKAIISAIKDWERQIQAEKKGELQDAAPVKTQTDQHLENETNLEQKTDTKKE